MIRTGQQFIAGLNDGRHLYVDGRLVRNVADYAPFQGVVATLASLFDAQHSDEYRDVMTYVSPASGERVSTTYLPARTLEQMHQRLRCDFVRTDLTYGCMGRLTDFMSAFLLDQAASLRFAGKHEAAARTQWYLDRCRERDLQITHALIDPQSDRSKVDAPAEAVRIVERRPDGLVVRGARLLSTLAPVADESYVGPYFPRKAGEEDYAVCFSVPLNAPGLKILARETYHRGQGLFDRPLSGRFDEGDAIIVFEDVFVPAERVMVGGDVDAYNAIVPLMPGYLGIQAMVRSSAKLRFLTGLASTVARANGRDKTPRFQTAIGELVAYMHVTEGMHQAACLNALQRLEAGERGEAIEPARLGEPGTLPYFGLAALNVFYPYVNGRAIEVVRDVAGSGGLAMSEADYLGPDLQGLVDRLIVGPGIDARHRLQLMKLVWDATATEFGSRQALYERYYSGDPDRNRQLWFTTPKRAEAEAMVKRLLGW